MKFHFFTHMQKMQMMQAQQNQAMAGGGVNAAAGNPMLSPAMGG